MDCPKAELAMMHYVEKTLKPADARDLATHILQCEPCRTLYLLMDQAAELLTAPALNEAPIHFTAQVMARIEAEAVTPAETVSAGLRILWGLSGIVMGVALLFAFNPQWEVVMALQNALASAAVIFNDALAWVNQIYVSEALINSGIGIVALVFAVVIAGLLYGLHRGENTPHKSFNA